MPQHKKKNAGKRVDISTSATAILGATERSTGQPKSAALKLAFNRDAPIRSRVAGVLAFARGAKLRNAPKGAKKIKKSPGFTLELPADPAPTGNGSVKLTNPAQKFDETEHHRAKPTIP